MVERFAADPVQAERVHRSAIALLDQVAADWGLAGADPRRVLRWAARLHESGLSVAQPGYHRHGAYLVAHSDMPGFSIDDQMLLAAVIRSHRRKIRFAFFDGIASQRVEEAIRIAVLFRLAVLLNRGRIETPEPELRVSGGGRTLRLNFPEGWLEGHPLTAADLAEENEQLRAIEYEIRVGTRG
jgi:exopolyphosphatase/guanosine-5'-triphosphate,3'-diphosphate pyrophosphatase